VSQDLPPPALSAPPASPAPALPAQLAPLETRFSRAPVALPHHKSARGTHATTPIPSGPASPHAPQSSACQKPLSHADHHGRAAPPTPNRTTRGPDPDISPALFERIAPPHADFSPRFVARHPSAPRSLPHRLAPSSAQPL